MANERLIPFDQRLAEEQRNLLRHASVRVIEADLETIITARRNVILEESRLVALDEIAAEAAVLWRYYYKRANSGAGDTASLVTFLQHIWNLSEQDVIDDINEHAGLSDLQESLDKLAESLPQ